MARQIYKATPDFLLTLPSPISLSSYFTVDSYPLNFKLKLERLNPFSKSFDPAQDLPALNGKVIIVTGGNANLGLYTILHLARRGAKIYMGARDGVRANEAIAWLYAQGLEPGNGEVKWLDLDLADPQKAKKAGEEFLRHEDRLDVLIHNAGMMQTPYARSFEGIQDVMMINHISPFILTQTLLPILRKTAQVPENDVRVVTVSSEVHSMIKNLQFRTKDDINREFKDSWSPSMLRYAQSKFCNILFTNELQRQFDEEGVPIIALSVNPGGIRTDRTTKLLDNWNFIVRGLYRLILQLYPTPYSAAYTNAFAAASPEVRKNPSAYRAGYLNPPGKLEKSSLASRDRELGRELWNTTEQLVESFGLQ